MLVTLASLILPSILYAAYRDYHNFISLGPGGTPQTVAGYLRITFLRLFALRNPYLPAPTPLHLRFSKGYLSNSVLSRRIGPRPEVTGIAPHRQTTEKGSPKNYGALVAAIRELHSRHPNRLRINTSCFEKFSTGLFSVNKVNRTCNGEVCHAHPSDGSLHLTLHPADARIVLEAGWGERHPLARGGWCTRFVPLGFLMIYAPRSEEELTTVMHIVTAAAGWVGGEPLNAIKDEGGEKAGYGMKDEKSHWPRVATMMRQR
ncbi:MAG: hypothetical protein M1824_002617 [Vezdaea acicularis]|nr:MAG: hypothetical protein M1824_002617 [Vezdaea acicularis]